MSTYTAEVTREGRWWMINVPEVDGLTQARRLADAEQMARELVAVTTGQDIDTIEVHASVTVVDGVDVAAEVEAIRRERERAAQMERDASDRARALARALAELNVPQRDIGAALGVSYQRAHQLISA